MRKDKKQKKVLGKQLEFFSSTGEPVSGNTDGISETVSSGATLSSRLMKQRSLTVNLLEKIVDYENLERAFKQVQRNGGSSGVDNVELDEFSKWFGKSMKVLSDSLVEETYQVNLVRKVEIPKPTGGVRTLGIPTIKDRVIQQAIHQKLSIYYEPHFSQHSYGFRPGHDASQAVLQASRYIADGKEWVVDIDLENFFDKINHDRLMQRLSKGIGDKRLLRLINAFLKAGTMAGGLQEQRIAGTPQGGPLSPLLSNIVLDELDKELEKRGHSFCRYADDCNIYVQSKKAGERVLVSVVDFIERKLKLKVNRLKSGVKHCSQVKFLGYTLMPKGGIRIADKSIQRFKDKIRAITKRNRGVKFDQLIKELNEVIIGWSNYFWLTNTWLATIRDIDGWIRRKLRCYRLKQSNRKYAIYKLLRSFGIAHNTSWNVAMYSPGWWQMSQKAAVTKAMSIRWFSLQGLHSLFARLSG